MLEIGNPNLRVPSGQPASGAGERNIHLRDPAVQRRRNKVINKMKDI